MSLLVVGPEFLASAAADLKGIGAELNAAHAAAAGPTTGLLAAGADEVSTAVASLFSGHSQAFQAIGAQASKFHAQFVQALSGAGGAYAAAEAANASPLQAAEQAAAGVQWFSPWESLTGRPLVGNGANGVAGTGQAGGDGGWILGNGGNGGSGASGQAGGAGGAGGLLVGNGGNGGAGGANAPGGAGGIPSKLFGHYGTGGQSGTPLGTGGVSMQVFQGTEPVVDVSVGGGPSVPLLVDTGSTGLVIPLRDVGLFHLGLPTGFGTGAFTGGVTYGYITFDTTVNFGNGIVSSTPVDVVLFGLPTSFASFANGNGAAGILGVGVNAGGPGPSSPVTGLPGNLNQGVLINEPKGYLQFGPNPLSPVNSVTGAPVGNLEVQVGNGPKVSVPGTFIDSGGVDGTIPSSVAGSLPSGSVITVYNSTGSTELYQYTTSATNTPTVVSGDSMNTGFEPFALGPVYISNSPGGTGTTVFDY